MQPIDNRWKCNKKNVQRLSAKASVKKTYISQSRLNNRVIIKKRQKKCYKKLNDLDGSTRSQEQKKTRTSIVLIGNK